MHQRVCHGGSGGKDAATAGAPAAAAGRWPARLQLHGATRGASPPPLASFPPPPAHISVSWRA